MNRTSGSESQRHPMDLGEVQTGLLRRLPVLGRMVMADPALLDIAVVLRRLRPGETVYHAGQEAHHLFLVVSGSFKLLRTSTNGRTVTVNLALQGEAFGGLGLAAGQTYRESAVALTASQVMSLPRTELRELAVRHPVLTHYLIELLVARLEDAEAKILRLSSAPARSRVATALLLVLDRGGGRNGRITLTRRDLASLTGMATETTSRVLSALQGEGAIVRRREFITVVDRNRLAEAAEF